MCIRDRNYSTYSGYGPDYGANYIQPASIISQEGFDNLGNSRIYNNMEEEKIKALRGFVMPIFHLNIMELLIVLQILKKIK